jgi:hypothetical protein
LDRHVSM